MHKQHSLPYANTRHHQEQIISTRFVSLMKVNLQSVVQMPTTTGMMIISKHLDIRIHQVLMLFAFGVTLF